MKGDFSIWRHDPRSNDQGVLHQQGRVTLDADLTAGELIDLAWRIRTARDVVGEGVAAVPASDPDGFRVVGAEAVGDGVRLQVHPGRAWVDGVHVHLPPGEAGATAPVERDATWLPDPLGGGGDASSISEGVRDAVVLEVWLEELNAFQEPDRLLEPALGGPDTTERIAAHSAFRLIRLGEDEACCDLRERLRDGPQGKGRLTVSLDPPVATGGDCPTVDGGGYTGFEHHLYRVEVAETNDSGTRLKWSRFNGGLVGRGRFEAGSPSRVIVTANRAAIVNSGLDSFYLEALAWDEEFGHWRVVYGSTATLDSDLELELADPPVLGSFSFGSESVFFRLWDGIRDLDEFTAGPAPLDGNGINLVADALAPDATYRPGDQWTFSVRAGEIENPGVLVDDEPPAGLELHRVPLAEIVWSDRAAVGPGEIRDCRRRFRPLTNQKGCCTLLVGDGVRTFGDFNSLEEAAEHLPPSGGDLCLLPGVHRANLVLEGCRDIRIRGCARHTLVLPHEERAEEPVLTLRDCRGIVVSDLDLVSFFGPVLDVTGSTPGASREITVRDCRMIGRRWVLRLDRVDDALVSGNRCWLLDAAGGLAAFRIRARDVLVERNRIGVWPLDRTPGDEPDRPDSPNRPADPCAEPGDVYGQGIRMHLDWVRAILVTTLYRVPVQPYRAWGGIHLRGECERARLLENHIDGGAGHGVTLGGILPGDDPPGDVPDGATERPTITLGEDRVQGRVRREDGSTAPSFDLTFHAGGTLAASATTTPEGNYVASPGSGALEVGVQPGFEILSIEEVEFEGGRFYNFTVGQVEVTPSPEQGFLYRIEMEANDIQGMGLSGIGFHPYTDTPPAPNVPDSVDEIEIGSFLATIFAPREILGVSNVVRDLEIRNNRIHGNLRAVFDEDLRARARKVGQGGISLGLVETGIVEGNQIHGNGTNAVNPTCGIFVGYAEDLEIRRNHITGNGPVVSETYETDKFEGLRGGVFVRFASAFLVGGEADAQQKPAVRIMENRVDQPAGRAVTVFAFGPVACVGNYLNSERAGRWSIVDTVAGGVLIVNLGGLHRQRRMAPALSGANGFVPDGRAYNGFGNQALAELLLPGGEVLLNDNQIRLGTAHRSVTATVVFTADDLGFDGNQSSVFRDDLLFANAVALAFTLRTTDNRFREHTRQCYLSLVTWAFGIDDAARLLTMNTTAHNQADHCIVVGSNATRHPDPLPHGLPVVRDGNLIANNAVCQQLIGDNAGRYVLMALLATILRQRAANVAEEDVPTEEYREVGKQAVHDAANSVQVFNQVHRQSYLQENARLVQLYGAEHPRVLESTQRLEGGAAAIRELGVEADLVLVREAAVPDAGAILDGRVTDENQRAREGLVVELVGVNDQPLGIQGRTGPGGYYAIGLDQERIGQVEEQQLFLRVSDGQGRVVHRAEEPVAVAAETRVRSSVTLVRPEAVPATEGHVIYRRAPTHTRSGQTSTPLEDVKGIGPVTAQRLRDAGIADLEAFMRTPGARLVEIQGFDADVMRERARRRLDEIEEERRGGNDG